MARKENTGAMSTRPGEGAGRADFHEKVTVKRHLRMVRNQPVGVEGRY
jgi:hypothetical protein